ncbi:MAG TPA: glycosyltransferase [Rhodopila sp.]|uniref:glycosyltransferase n=1 Tax=Rhodopila sp. TaxID=2480087 RepID=UPI002CB65A7D|nr:glycosyltransferase [Rhodopila sp.]HVY17512.1 glycosyltransferase [Rhodopila sp.]
MWPLDLSGRDVVKLPGETAIAWAQFDAAWYRAYYPDIPDGEPAELLAHYLGVGQAQAYSPNRLFDEAWARGRYPGIASRIQEGRFSSAFDAYCRRGCLDRSGHWLFDELAYRHKYTDLTDDVLAASDIANGYDHYLRHGVQEDRVGHPLFDPSVYLANFDAVDARAIRASGMFQHYLARIEAREPELRTSVYFDPQWYLRRYPEVAEAIKAGTWLCALHHYLCNDRPTEFDPCEGFSEAFYLSQDIGLQQVIAEGHFRNGYAHFVRFGARELRQPNPVLDLKLYAGQAKVESDLKRGVAPDAFVHWLLFGARDGQEKETHQVLTDQQARVPFVQAAVAMLPIAGRFGYDFTVEDPVCTVVVSVQDNFVLAMASLAALRASTRSPVALLVIDRGSQDECRALERYVPGARVERFEDDIGLVQAANAGWQLATTPYVLFLSAFARLAPGSLDRALRRMDADETIGAVAALLVRPLGTIAEAGGIIWSDGGLHRYQVGMSPLTPEANFVRDVDFGGLGCLLVRRSALEGGGLDPTLTPPYAAADLGLRIARDGLRVVYDPSVLVFYDDADDGPGTPDAGFVERHKTALAAKQARGSAGQFLARHAGSAPHRVLFIDDTVPLRVLGSGFVRSNDLLRAMAATGCAVTVFPINGSPYDRAHVYGDMPETVEVMHSHGADRLKAFLEGRPDYYDTVWICRSHNLNRVGRVLSQLRDSGTLTARIVLDTEAVEPRRDALRASLFDQAFNLKAAMRRFVATAALSDVTVAVTDAEAEILREQGVPRVATLGHMIDPRPTPRPFADRSGMLFVGAIHRQDSPNFDGLAWFVDEILPRIEAELGWAARLSIAGYVAPSVDMSRFQAHPRVDLHGPVPDLATLYNQHRVFVAPTRFAAGAPYKVLEAAAAGVPVVATDLLAGQLGWESGTDLLSAPVSDPAAFAKAVLAVHEDEAMWDSLREAALDRLADTCSRSGFEAALWDVFAACEGLP